MIGQIEECLAVDNVINSLEYNCYHLRPGGYLLEIRLSSGEVVVKKFIKI